MVAIFRRKLAQAALVVIAVAGIGVALTMIPARAASASYTGPVFAGNSTTQCLDVANAAGVGTSGLKMQTWTCGANRFQDQVFFFDGTHGLLEYIGSNGSTECVVESGATPYNQLELGSCPATSNVTLTLVTGGVQFKFADGNVMDIKGNGTTDGTPVGAFGPNGAANQIFHILQNPGSAAA